MNLRPLITWYALVATFAAGMVAGVAVEAAAGVVVVKATIAHEFARRTTP